MRELSVSDPFRLKPTVFPFGTCHCNIDLFNVLQTSTHGHDDRIFKMKSAAYLGATFKYEKKIRLDDCILPLQ